MAFQNIAGRLVDVIFGYDFFVSYTWADGSKYAHSLYEKLKAQGFTVFLDEEDYARGDNWTLLGRRALRKTRQLILVATPKIHASGPVLKELTAFESTGRRIIPIEIGDSLDLRKYPKSPLLPLIPAELLKINQPLQEGKIPNDVPSEVIRELRKGFQHVRQSQKRIRILFGVCITLVALLVLTVWAAIWAMEKKSQALQTLSQSDLARSEDLLGRGDTPAGLVFLTRAVRDYPPSRAAGDRLWFALTQRAWPQARTAPMRHSEKILSVAFNNDGKRIVTASNDNTACVWDALTGQRIGKPLPHKKTVFVAAFSPDGSRVATASRDGTAKIWEASTRPLSDWLKHGNVIGCLAFSHTGRWLATGSQDRTASVWDGHTGERIGQSLPHSGEVHTVVFHPREENLLLTVSGTTAQVWNALTGEKVRELKHTAEVYSAGFSPDGRQIITASADGAARIWETADETSPPMTLKHDEDVKHAAFSPNGEFIATLGLKDVYLWNADGSKLVPQPLHHSEPVTCIKFSPDSERLLSASDNGQAQMWAVQSGELKGEPIREQSSIRSLDFSPDGESAVVATAAGIARVWATAPVHPVSNLLSHKGSINALACSSDAKLLITASSDGFVRIWNVENGQLVAKPLPHDSEVLSAAFSPDGKYVVTGAADNKVRIWLAASAELVDQPVLQDSPVSHVAFGPNGKSFATATDAGEARLWNISDHKQLGVSMWHRDRITSLVFSPDNRYLLTASWDNTAQIWDASSGKAGFPLPDESGKEIECAVFNPHGNLIATTSRSGAVCIWDTTTGRKRITHWMPKAVKSCAFSADGAYLVTCCENGTAMIWNTATGKAVSGALRHTQEVLEAAFSPDGRRVATGSSDGTAMLWEITTGEPLSEPLKHSDAVQHVLFADAGHLITSFHNSVRIWDVVTPDKPSQRLRLAEFAQAFAPARLEASNRIQSKDPVPTTLLLANFPPSTSSVTIDKLGAFLKWFFDKPNQRTLSPFSRVTLSKYIEARIEDGTDSSLEEAALLAEGNSTWLEQIARAKKTRIR